MLDQFAKILFDCDGVVLNSNKIKTEAFKKVAAKYSRAAAQELADFNIQHGGISRHVKFDYFAKEILPKYSDIIVNVDELLEHFSIILQSELQSCEIDSNILKLREENSGDWGIISGGDQIELRTVFERRGISNIFNLGIFGSPRTKFDIIRDEKFYDQPEKTLFIGDSILDFEVARHFNFSFIFIYGWTEVNDWKNFVDENSIRHVQNFKELLGF